MNITNFLIPLIILNEILFVKSSVVRFNNQECRGFDEKFLQVRECRLKVQGRGKISLNIYLKLLQLPLKNLTVRCQLLRKSHEYRPFLYNSSIDFCSFLRNGHKHLYWKLLWDIVRPFTNVNHSCPHNDDIIIKNLIVDENKMKLILFPSGEYLIRVAVYYHQELKLTTNTFWSIKGN